MSPTDTTRPPTTSPSSSTTGPPTWYVPLSATPLSPSPNTPPPPPQNNYCKPSAKSPSDRRALLDALVHSNGKFFLGTDSARKPPPPPFSPSPPQPTNNPSAHDISAKKGPGNTAAGVFTQPFAVGYVLTALDEALARRDVAADAVTDAALAGFLSGYGRQFYGVPAAEGRIRVRRGAATVPAAFKGAAAEVVPFRAGEGMWGVEWV